MDTESVILRELYSRDCNRNNFRNNSIPIIKNGKLTYDTIKKFKTEIQNVRMHEVSVSTGTECESERE